MKKLTKINLKFFAVVVAVFLLVFNSGINLIGIFTSNSSKVYADTTTPTSISLSNSNFTNPTSGTYPRTPTSWSVVNSTDSASIVGGTINLEQTSFEENMEDNYKLDYKPYSYESMPDNYVLLINSKNSASYYGYKSSSLTLNTSSYYTISVMAYTQRNSGTLGTIKLVSDDIESTNQDAKLNINPNGNWTKYTFYVETNSTDSVSINLELWLGDEDLTLSSGAVFYDNVQIYKLSSSDYYNKLNYSTSGTYNVLSFKNTQVQSVTNPSFENGTNGWTMYAGTNSNLTNGNYVSGSFNIDDSFNSSLTQVSTNPTTNGVYENHKALLINNLQSGSYYYTSSSFTVTQHKLYKLSIWAYTDTNLDGTAQIKLIETSPYDDSTSYEPQTFTISDISTSGEWTEYSFYINASPYTNTELTLQLWLGNDETGATGYVFFDNITMEEITSSSYSASSSNSNVTVANLDITTDPTISNGAFNYVLIDDTTKTYPYAPKNWTLKSTTTNQTSNGIINTANNLSSLSIINPGSINYNNLNNNILMIGNLGSNYQYYTSSSTTLNADSYYKISVTAQTQNLSGTYASVRLVNNSGIILGSIENINSENWTTYTFLIKTGYNSQSISIQLGLGANNQGSGYAFFDNVKQLDSTETEYDSTVANSQKVNLASLDFTNISSYQTNGLYTPYDFEASNTSGVSTNYIDAGVLNTNNFEYPNEYFPDLTNPMSPDGTSGNVLLIHSGEDANYSFTSTKSFAFTSGSYYKITVWVKTVGLSQDEANKQVSGSTSSGTEYYPFGATVSLTNLNSSFTGINTDDHYEQYTFYINCTEDTNVNILLGLGNSKALTKGYVFFSNVDISNIEEEDYTSGVSVLEEDDAPTNVIAVGSTTTSNDDNTDTNDSISFDWLIIPTLITSLAIIIAIVGYGIRQIDFKRPTKVGMSNYDREKTLKVEQEHREALKLREEKLQTLKNKLADVQKDITQSKKIYKKSISVGIIKSIAESSITEEQKAELSKQQLDELKKTKQLELKREKEIAYKVHHDQLIAEYNSLNAEIDAIYQEELRLIKEYKEYKKQVQIKRKEAKAKKRKEKLNAKKNKIKKSKKQKDKKSSGDKTEIKIDNDETKKED